MLLRRLKYPNTTGLIMRRTYPDLYKSHIVKMYEEFPEVMQRYNVSNKELLLPNGSRLFFGSAEHPKDLSAFHSSEFSDIMPDEAQEFSAEEIERLSGSNRCTTNHDITPKMIMPFMPGISESGLPPVGLRFLKRVFVDKKLEGKENNRNWKFIQAFGWDNIEWARKELEMQGISEEEFYSWSEADRREFFIEYTEYGQNLAATTNDALRNAWLYGLWDTFEGQFFQQFSREKHVISPEEAAELRKPWHKKWASGDWGYDHPHSIYMHSQSEDGLIITSGEIWGRLTNETDLGRNIGAKYAGQKLSAFPFSWDAGKLSSRSNPKFPKSISQMLNDALPKGMPNTHPADSSPGSRIAGARLLSQLLDAGLWKITTECTHLIDCLENLIRDPDNPEDVMKVDYSENGIGDDPYDAARMGIQYMLKANPLPKSVVIQRAVQAAMTRTAIPAGATLQEHVATCSECIENSLNPERQGIYCAAAQQIGMAGRYRPQHPTSEPDFTAAHLAHKRAETDYNKKHRPMQLKKNWRRN
jgi:hypothetical protein